MAIALSLDMNLEETRVLLKKYGYCLSRSIAADMVVKWFLTYPNGGDGKMLHRVNEVLVDMELPLLMTRTG